MKTLVIVGSMLATLTIGPPAFAHKVHHSRTLRPSVAAQPEVKKSKVYYGVGFGDHHRTTETGGNAGGYSDRN